MPDLRFDCSGIGTPVLSTSPQYQTINYLSRCKPRLFIASTPNKKLRRNALVSGLAHG